MSNSIDVDYTEPHNLATQITDMWHTWNASRQVARTRWQEVINYVYATSTRETTNAKNNWGHSTHIPKLTQIFDNLGANYWSALFGAPYWFRWRGADQPSVNLEKRKVIEKYIETKHLSNGFKKEMLKCLNDWVQYGNCFAMVTYKSEGHTDPETQENIAGYNGPTLTRISPYDIVFDARATDFLRTSKIIREVITRGDLVRQIEEHPELNYDEDVVANLIARRTRYGSMDETEVSKQVQNRFDGFETSGSYMRSSSIELLHFYGDIFDNISGELIKNACITVADQHWPIRMEFQRTASGFPHIYHCGWRLRPDNMWAMGPLDNLIGMQYMIDHWENAKSDAFDQMLTPDEVYVGNVQVQYDGPVRRFIIDDKDGRVDKLAPDPTILQADSHIQYKEAQMEAYAGAPREAMGIRSPGEKTAFEVQQLLTAAGRLFQHKLEYFEEEFLEPVLNAELESGRRNLDVIDLITILDDELQVTQFMKITKQDLTGSGKLVPVGARHYSRQALLAQNLRDFSDILVKDPTLAAHFPASVRAQAWQDLMGFDKINGIGLYQKFGGIVENVEMQQVMQTAQDLAIGQPTVADQDKAMETMANGPQLPA